MRGFITSILTAIAITSLHAEPNTPIRPKLIVGLTVDQLNTELITQYQQEVAPVQIKMFIVNVNTSSKLN